MLTLEKINSILNYDAKSGELVWKTNNGRNCRGVGLIAGTVVSKGYRQIQIDGKRYLTHRLIWFVHFGKFPVGEIDHIDRDVSNNRIENLRDATHSLNQSNKGAYGKSGIKGVIRYKGKWRSSIKVDGGVKYLGTYESSDLAHSAFKNAHVEKYGCASEYFKEFYAH